MELLKLVETSRAMAETRARLAKRDLLAAILLRAEANEVPLVVGYLSGNVPRLGLGYATLGGIRVAAAAEPRLRLTDVGAAFEEIANTRGPDSSGRRAEIAKDLLRRATSEEQAFVRRLLLDDLRQGSLEGVMVDAVAHAAGVPAAEVRRALMVRGELAVVAGIALSEGKGGLEKLEVEPFRAVRPMLAQTASDVAEALATLETAVLEFKIDGARVQVHKLEGEIRVFTRSANDVTHACPEIVEAVRPLRCESVVLDARRLLSRRTASPILSRRRCAVSAAGSTSRPCAARCP